MLRAGNPSGVPGVEVVSSLAEAARGAGVVSLHVPMSWETARLVRAETLALMDGRPVLINTARDGLVDLGDALDALDDGTLSGVALDVTDPEPLPAAHPLRDHPQAIVTAFHSVEATEEFQRRAAEEVARALRGEAPECPLNSIPATVS